MYLNYRAISRVVAFFTVIFAIAMIPSAIIGLICREFDIALIFSVLIFVEALFGISILYMVRPSQVLLRTRDGFLLVALCWFLACFLGSLPFYFSEYITSFADAFFEATSGFTTTGASILTDIEALPKALLFWRTFTQWMGGFGIVFIPIAILPALGFEGHSLATAEHQGISLDKLSPKLSDSARHLFKLYVVLTVAETVLLLLGGLSPFDAITHSFSTMSTGGFSNYNGNIGHFQSNYIYLIIAIFMFLAGVNFNLYFLGIQKRFKALFKDLEFKYYCMIVFASIALISMSLACIEKLESGFDGIIHVVFQVVSIMSTTGFSTIDYDALWPNFIKITLIFLMIVGGCSSSPAGGMKMIRALMVFKMIKRATILKLHPNAIADIHLNGKRLSTEILQAISTFVIFYFMLLSIGTIIVSFAGFDAVTSFTASLACISNVGHGLNAAGPVMNYSLFPDYVKFSLTLIMIMGRLELMTILAVLSPHFWNPNR